MNETRVKTLQATVTKKIKALAEKQVKNGKAKTMSDYIKDLIEFDTSGIKVLHIDITEYLKRHMPKNVTRDGTTLTVENSEGLIGFNLVLKKGKIDSHSFATDNKEIQSTIVAFSHPEIEKHIAKIY